MEFRTSGEAYRAYDLHSIRGTDSGRKYRLSVNPHVHKEKYPGSALRGPPKMTKIDTRVEQDRRDGPVSSSYFLEQTHDGQQGAEPVG